MLRRLRWLGDWATYLLGFGYGSAGCCGCGQSVVNVAIVDDLKGREVPGETYCWDCWYARPILVNFDHIELPRPLVDVPWREADQVVRDLIAERQAA
jgi:hypothetical protein